MDQLGIIIIGRNEGERLVRCLASVGNAHPLVYVDSGSTDNSVANARSAGASVVELDMSIAFNAARARNEGFARLMEIAPASRWVQFIDGDCEMVAGWFERAVEHLQSDVGFAAVCGRLRERFPEKSIYNRICDMEWESQPGVVDACGGIAMYRVEYFQAVGGFDPTVPAGEEPELCQRLRQKGWKIIRLKDEMAWHDSAMTQFKQWWRRQVRTGYNDPNVVNRFKLMRFRRQIVSARIWTVGTLGLAIVLAAAGWMMGGVAGGFVGVGFVLLLIVLQIARISWKIRRPGLRGRDAMAFGAFTLISKWGQFFGEIRYHYDRLIGQPMRLIEYKGKAVSSKTTATGQS